MHAELVEQPKHRVVDQVVQRLWSCVERGNGRRDDGSQVAQRREVPQVNRVQRRLPNGEDERPRSLSTTSAARQIKLCAKPFAIAPTVFMLQGAMIMPSVTNEPLNTAAL